MGKTDDGEYLTFEEYVKYMNNNGNICNRKHEITPKAECFARFTYEKSEGRLIVLEIQGSIHNLCDPEIASSELSNYDGTVQFCNDNLTQKAIKIFFSKHQCNFYCNLLKLKLCADVE